MNEIRISFLATSRAVDVEIKSENDISPIVNDLFMVFARDIDYENFKINIENKK